MTFLKAKLKCYVKKRSVSCNNHLKDDLNNYYYLEQLFRCRGSQVKVHIRRRRGGAKGEEGDLIAGVNRYELPPWRKFLNRAIIGCVCMEEGLLGRQQLS